MALILYLGFFTGVTKLNVDIWSSKALMADIWTRDHPTSVRAHQLLADLWSRLGHHGKAGEVMNKIALLRPDAMGAQIQTLLVTCRDTPESIDSHLETTNARIPGTHYDNAAVSTLFMLRNVHDKKCPELSSDDLLELIDTVLANETVARRPKAVSDFLYLKAVILLDKGEIQNTVAHLHSSFHQTPNYRLGLMAVKLLYGLGEYEEAMRALEDVQELRLKPWSPDNFKLKEVQTWKRRIQYKLKQQDANSPTVKAVEVE
jgi:tetratricopeptide (TPR) repeat protein